MLSRSSAPLKTIPNQSVSDIKVSPNCDRIGVLGSSKIFHHNSLSKYFEWDYLDNSLRYIQLDGHKTLAVFENLHIGHVTCAVFADASTLITCGSDTTVCVWEFTNVKKPELKLLTCMRGHRKKCISLSVSYSYSVVVSGGEDGVAIIWDLNRMHYVRSMNNHEGPVIYTSIHETTGDILTCCASAIRLWSINGELILTKSVLSLSMDPLTCCAFYEGRLADAVDWNLIFTGHRRGQLKVWSKFFNTSIESELNNVKGRWDLRCVRSFESTSLSPLTTIYFAP